MVATFIGVLELLKSQRIRVQQARPFDDIWIEGRAEEDRTLPIPEAEEDADQDADQETQIIELRPGAEEPPS